MRSAIFCALLTFAASGVLGQTPNPVAKTAGNVSTPATHKSGYTPDDKKTRFHRYIKSMVGPESPGKDVARAGFPTWTNSPKEWDTHWDGFGKRLASNIGKNVIKNTTVYALEEAFKLDSRFFRSTKRDFGSKVRNALISPFTARNRSGKIVFGFPRIIGAYTSSIIAAETWYPKRYGWKDGLRTATISFGTNALFNLVKEFIKRK